MTVADAVEELFHRIGSVADDDTVAVFEIGPSNNGLAVMVTVARAVFVMVPRLHVTVPSAKLQEP